MGHPKNIMFYSEMTSFPPSEGITKLSLAPSNFSSLWLRLHGISNSMNYLESKGFPLPDSMTEAQYEQILKYETKRGQTLYLDAIVEGMAILVVEF